MGSKIIIHRRCACGCGQITNYGKKWINGHHRRGIKPSKETKLKMSLSAKNMSKEKRLKVILSTVKFDPNDEYCDIWKDREYKKDLRKDYCENADCTKINKRLVNHHINLNKKDCRPFNVMTLCKSCHATLHWKLGRETSHKDFLIIIRQNRISYINKKTRKIITIKRKTNE